MNSDTEIVLIQRPEQEQAIEALIAARQAYSMEELAVMQGSTDEILHRFYLEAAERKLIRLVNLWVRALAGGPNPAGVWEWRLVAITGDVPTVVAYDGRSGTTRATVGDLVVLTNEIPGKEILQPGQWLLRLRAAYIQQMAGVRHTQEIAESQTREKKVLDFLADV